MSLYKLTAPRQYGDMPKGYEFQVPSRCIPKPSAEEVEEVIKKLGFNKDAQSYKSPGNFIIVEIK